MDESRIEYGDRGEMTTWTFNIKFVDGLVGGITVAPCETCPERKIVEFEGGRTCSVCEFMNLCDRSGSVYLTADGVTN